MPLTHPYEEHEVGPEIRKIYRDVRAAFDLPFVPTVFKLAAGCPEYLYTMWRDLEPVAWSREFQNAALSLDEFVRSEVVSGGWKFGDQERTLASQKISSGDMAVLAGVVGIFVRAMPRMVLFTRLMQRGYSGGQKGRVSAGKQQPALSRLVTLHVPTEEEAGMRAWLIFADIKRTMKVRNVPSPFRVLLPFPGYLGSVWMDSKKVFGNREFLTARDQVARRSMGLLSGLPVKDHREIGRTISHENWRDVEESVDEFARLLPQLAVLVSVWQRSFALSPRSRAA